MSEQYVEEAEETFSPFWPLLVLIVGLIIWFGYQTYAAYTQSTAFATEFKNAQPTISAAQNAESKLFAVFQDLQQTAVKDQYAAQIVKESHIQLKSPNGGESSSDGSSH